MVKLNTGPDPEVQNVHFFSDKIGAAIREAIQANALHPASIVGTLNYHAMAVASAYVPAFVPQQAPKLFMPDGSKV